MNPYVSNPDDIPPNDQYADLPFYGRYFPRQDDFRVDLQYANSQSSDAMQYWASVLERCDESVRLYPAFEGGRDVFALGTVVVKSSHLHNPGQSPPVERDYSYADANEVQAIAIAKSILKDVRVPEIYFTGQINGRQVLVQERLPGVGLSVAWAYLSQAQKESCKQQARTILLRLHTFKPTDGRQARSYVVQDPDILSNGRILAQEGDILFSDDNTDPDMSFMHNDLNTSNIIVDNDKITGLIDWEMAGFFGRNTASEDHRKMRSPQREYFVNANLSEEKLQDNDILFWNDLYEDGFSGSTTMPSASLETSSAGRTFSNL